MKRVINILFCAAAVFALGACTPKPAERWSEEKANAWYAEQEWPVGCNYVPSYAINPLEIWQAESFNPEVIDHELGLAEGLGFNTVRMYLHDLVWEADRDGFKTRINQFLDLCEKHHIKVIFTIFTNGGNYDNPHLGKQPEAVDGVHSSQWVQSPGYQKVNDPTTWPALKVYVQDILKTYGNDSRILYWCLYNEPENLRHGAESMGLLKAVFEWAREINPSQPLSSPLWIRPGQKGTKTRLDIVDFICSNSDIITFHCYYDDELETFISMLKPFNRPMVCQEYMGRPQSTFEGSLPILKRERIGAINWGLVEGKCNFHLPWSHKEGDPEPTVWFHDIYNLDDEPYSEAEVDFIRSLTATK